MLGYWFIFYKIFALSTEILTVLMILFYKIHVCEKSLFSVPEILRVITLIFVILYNIHCKKSFSVKKILFIFNYKKDKYIQLYLDIVLWVL